MCRAVLAAERIVHIAGEGKPTFAKLRLQRLVEVLAACEDVNQCLYHSDAGIARGGAAESDDEIAASVLDSSREQFAHAVCCGAHRVALLLLDKAESARLSHFHYCRAVGRHAVMGIRAAHHQVVYVHRLQCSARGCRKRCKHSVAAVRHRQAQRVYALRLQHPGDYVLHFC